MSALVIQTTGQPAELMQLARRKGLTILVGRRRYDGVHDGNGRLSRGLGAFVVLDASGAEVRTLGDNLDEAKGTIEVLAAAAKRRREREARR